MLTINNLTVKNFLSVGNQTQGINFQGKSLILVIGENLDLGGDDAGARNGTGKTTIVNAISYAFYGEALTSIRKDNLVNKTNNKDMVVSVEFTLNGRSYKIERGRKPAMLRFYIDDMHAATNEAQGENRETQAAINKLLGMSHQMFKHIVALNTYTQPFLACKTNEQREIIEQLLGITMLSEKAELLREQMRETKAQSTEEKYRIDSVTSANEKIEESIKTLKLKSSAWDTNLKDENSKLRQAILKLEQVDISAEIELHAVVQEKTKQLETLQILEKELALHSNALEKITNRINVKLTDIEYAEKATCPTCEQSLHDKKHQELLEKLQLDLAELQKEQKETEDTISAINQGIKEIGEIGEIPTTYYETLQEAYEHKGNLQDFVRQLEQNQVKENPYNDQIQELESSALQKVDYSLLNELEDLYKHQDFLYKLLTAKDSFIRTRIIEQNLTYLNSRLAYYLGQVKLPHTVVFQPDLSVEIQELGRELDFDNLSRGERNRLILSLSWAFRDVWESLYQPINLLFIDELIDSGMDASGVEASMSILKEMTRTSNKNIFLISHRDELVNRVHSVLKVVKQNGFTSYSNDLDYMM